MLLRKVNGTAIIQLPSKRQMQVCVRLQVEWIDLFDRENNPVWIQRHSGGQGLPCLVFTSLVRVRGGPPEVALGSLTHVQAGSGSRIAGRSTQTTSLAPEMSRLSHFSYSFSHLIFNSSLISSYFILNSTVKQENRK